MTALDAHDDEAIGRRSRVAAFVSLGGFVVVMATIVAGAIEIGRLESTKAELANANQSLKGEIGRLSDQRKKMEAEVAALEAKASSLDERIKDKQARLDFISFTLATGKYPAALKSLKSATSQDTSLRVYFHLQSAVQKGVYGRCAPLLKSKSYQVQPEIIVRPIRLAKTDVRYFKRTDKARATELAANLDNCVRSPSRVRLIKGYEDSKMVRPGQFEIWFATNER